jgi:hypothetical protein
VSLKVRPSKHLVHTQAELDAAYLQVRTGVGREERTGGLRAKMAQAERLADFRKMIEETPLVPSYGREPEQHEKIVHHAMT